MIVLGILGHPVAHSKSPAMHQAALAAAGLEGVYAKFDVAPGRLPEALRGLVALSVRGVNVTVPHKEAVLPLLDEVDPHARAIGAVNTIVRDGDRLIGSNTDAEGLARSLDEAKVRLEGAEVLVLGAGGAARAAVVGLAARGARRVRIAARRVEAAEALATSLRPATAGVPLEALGLGALEDSFRSTTLLVQSTSATLAGDPGAEAFAASLPLHALPDDAAVVDLVYKPLETTVLARARARGLHVVDGLGMLLHQGALAFERFTGHRADVEVMRQALARA